MKPLHSLLFLLCFFQLSCQRQASNTYSQQVERDSTAKDSVVNQIDSSLVLIPDKPKKIQVGASQLAAYTPMLQGKKVALVVNHTSVVGRTHLVDTLLSLGIEIKKIFAPEHGFRGKADAGETVKNDTDIRTGLPIVSLYGENKKPTKNQIQDIDVLVFDIQDVGVRFYTYISTLHYVMEACAENNKKLLLLDRPNPNGNYIDGCILQPAYSSFVGIHPIPIVHGLTVGELAKMINGERWLKNGVQCDLKIVTVQNYQHQQTYSLPIKPSPNLPNDQSVALYPSLCLFEGTIMSVGRGTDFPFQVIGYPDKRYGSFTFVPKSNEGAKYPLYENKTCFGKDLRTIPSKRKFTLQYVIDFYNKSPQKATFFNNFFDKLAGTDQLRKQIQAGMSEKAIKATWQKDLATYRQIRKKYLLYED